MTDEPQHTSDNAIATDQTDDAQTESETGNGEARLDAVEQRVDDHQAILDGLKEHLGGDGDGIGPVATRRGVLTAGGVLGLLGIGAGTASADPSGQIGTSSDPLQDLYTETLHGYSGTLTLKDSLDLGGNKLTGTQSINGGVTGNTEITDLVGSGLTINNNSLETTGGGGKWTDGNSGSSWLEPSDSETKIEGIDTIESNDQDSSLTITQDTNDNGGGAKNLTLETKDSSTNNNPGDIILDADPNGNGSQSISLKTGGTERTTVDSNGVSVKNGSIALNGNAIESSGSVSAQFDTNQGGTGSFDIRDGSGSLQLSVTNSGTLDLQGNNLTSTSVGTNFLTDVDSTTTGEEDFVLEIDDVSGNSDIVRWRRESDSNNALKVETDNGTTTSTRLRLDDDGMLGVYGNVTSDSAFTIETTTSGDLTLNASGDVALGTTLDAGGNKLTDTNGNLTIEGSSGNGVTINTDGSKRVLSLGVPTSDVGRTAGGNVVAGHPNNAVNNGAVGAVIGGGGSSQSDAENTVEDNYSVVGGGESNQAGSTGTDQTNATHATVCGGDINTASAENATVGGGSGNDATATEATVGGGNGNTASGANATVAGGVINTASGKRSTVPGGNRGAAKDDDSFVWNDGTEYHSIPNGVSQGLTSDTAVNGEPVTGANTFSASAASGFRFITGSSSVTYIDGSGNLTSAGNIDLAGNNLNNVASIDNGNSAISVDDNLQINGSNAIQDASSNSHFTVNDGGPLGVDQTLDMNGNDLLVEGNTQISGDSDVTVRIDNNDSASASDEFRVLGNTGNRKFDVDNNGDAKVHNSLTVSNDLTVNSETNFNSHVYTNGNQLDLAEGRFLYLRHEDNVSNDMWEGELAIDTNSDDLVFISGSTTTYTWSADSVSSTRYKENIEPWSADPYGALELEAKEYDLLEGPYGGDGPTQIGEYGFLAEAADECAPWVVQYVEITEENKDDFSTDDEHVGEYVPDRIDYDKFTIAHNEILSDHDEHLDDLQADLSHKQARIDDLEAEQERKDDRIDSLEAENERLHSRLDAIEAHLGLDGGTAQGVADD